MQKNKYNRESFMPRPCVKEEKINRLEDEVVSINDRLNQFLKQLYRD